MPDHANGPASDPFAAVFYALAGLTIAAAALYVVAYAVLAIKSRREDRTRNV